MKNNFRFIFPRLIGATVIVGIAALVITTLFKLMIGVILIGGVVNLIRRAAGGGRHEFSDPYSPVSGRQFGPYMNRQYSGPVSVSANIQNATIVPIN